MHFYTERKLHFTKHFVCPFPLAAGQSPVETLRQSCCLEEWIGEGVAALGGSFGSKSLPLRAGLSFVHSVERHTPVAEGSGSLVVCGDYHGGLLQTGSLVMSTSFSYMDYSLLCFHLQISVDAIAFTIIAMNFRKIYILRIYCRVG